MAIARQTTANKVKPLEGAKLRRGTLGTTVEAGEAVTLQSDTYWDPSNGAAAQLTVAIAIQGGIAGDEVDLVTGGPVECMTGATPGSLVYITTGGEFDHTGTTKKIVIGYAETATILFVQPQIIDFS